MLLPEAFGIFMITSLGPASLDPVQIIVYSVIKLIMMMLITYAVLIIVSVILSWVGGNARHPIIPLIYQLTEPVLRPFRKAIPPIAGIDLSPLFALITIRFLMLLLGW